MKAVNDILLSLKEPLQSYIETDSGFKLALSGQENRFEWNISCDGIVRSMPNESILNNDIKEGDKVYFSYFVCSDRSFDSDEDFFNPSIEANYMQQFIDGHGNRINIIAVPSIIDKKWVCSYINHLGVFIEGFEGTESQMERWKAQFKFGNVQRFKFENLIERKGEQYWKCHPDFIFAKKTSKGIKAIGNYILLEPIKQKITQAQLAKHGIQIPHSSIESTVSDRAILFSGGSELGIKKGQVIGFDNRYIQKYKFDGIEYIIIEKDRVLGIWE